MYHEYTTLCQRNGYSTRKGNLNDKNSNGYTELHYACYNNRLSSVVSLLNDGMDINLKDNIYGETPIMIACSCGSNDMVKLLLTYGADIHQKSKKGYSLIHFVCYYDHVDIIRILLVRGVNVNEKSNDGNTPLKIACCYDNYDIAKLLLESGANANSENKYNDTCMHVTCNMNYHDLTKLLLKHGANSYKKNHYDETPISIARKKGFHNIVKLINKEMKKRIYILSLIIQYDVMKHHIIGKVNNL